MKVVHKVIKETSEAIAREAYEAMAKHNAFYAEWPNREQFVEKNWQMFVDDARAALLKILSGDYPEAMKQPIYEAMIKDGAMRSHPTDPWIMNPPRGPRQARRRFH